MLFSSSKITPDALKSAFPPRVSTRRGLNALELHSWMFFFSRSSRFQVLGPFWVSGLRETLSTSLLPLETSMRWGKE